MLNAPPPWRSPLQPIGLGTRVRAVAACGKGLDWLLAGRGATDQRVASAREVLDIVEDAYPMAGDADFWTSHSVAGLIIGTAARLRTRRWSPTASGATRSC